MPNRIIKESICESLSLSESSIFVDDFYKRLITYADDYGRFNADPMIIAARLYPRELDIVSIEDVENALCELSGKGKLAFYTSEAKKEVYGCFPNWGSHQRIRGAKKKLPEPEDTKINDWYLRRYIPVDLKCKIIERDNYSCSICGKEIVSGDIPARRLVKMGTGLFHIDHIVPVIQGGRATEENLRLTCPKCNQSRKKTYTFEQIVDFCHDSEQDKSLREKLLQNAASCRPNPIQSNPIQSNTNTKPNADANEFVVVVNSGTEGYVTYSGRAVDDYMNRINPEASPTAMKALLAFENELSTDVCIRAFDIALDEKKTSWSYIKGILQNWKARGIRCIADLEEAQEKREGAKPSSRGQKKYREVTDKNGFIKLVEEKEDEP